MAAVEGLGAVLEHPWRRLQPEEALLDSGRTADSYEDEDATSADDSNTETKALTSPAQAASAVSGLT